MASEPYLVIRLVPESPVDGSAFSTYLDNLTLQALDANSADVTPVSDVAYAAPLSLVQWPPSSGWYLITATEQTSAATTVPPGQNPGPAFNYGTQLEFASTSGISVGAYVYSADQTTIPLAGQTVTAVTATTVTLNGPLPHYVPAGTVVSFVGQPGTTGHLIDQPGPGLPSFTLATSAAASADARGQLTLLHFGTAAGVLPNMTVTGPGISDGTSVASVDGSTVTLSQPVTDEGPAGTEVSFTMPPPVVQFSCEPSSATSDGQSEDLAFAADTDIAGIPVGAMVSPVPGLIEPGTVVMGAAQSESGAPATLTISPALDGPLPVDTTITLNFPLSSGIVQHTEQIPVGWDFFGEKYAVIPAAVATAILPLTIGQGSGGQLPSYLNVKIKASRGEADVPDSTVYYNVKVTSDAIPQSPAAYQGIPESETSLYFSLPAPPGPKSVSLEIPADGTPPPFDTLLQAMQTALDNDPFDGATLGTLCTSAAWCSRIAYDIVWSYRTDLPPLPDPLESLYTNPPNPGGGGSTTDSGGSSGATDNYEMDRQKFEGALTSYYATRDANAERLTKFVAAASAAIGCEQMSQAATAALLEFPVDASVAFGAAVESEVLLTGLGPGGTAQYGFGVPAAYFYALGTSLDKSTSAAQRYTTATRDSGDRLLQQFAASKDANLIRDGEPFHDGSPGSITLFQAARRLVALGVSVASGSIPVPVVAGTPLATLVTAWLEAGDPGGDDQTPPPTFQSKDYAVWAGLYAEPSLASGYLDLDLDALTQGYVIPAFTAAPAADASSGSALAFPAGSGIGPGMTVSGAGISPGTTVASVQPEPGGTVTVTLSAAVTGAVTTATPLSFNDPARTLAAQIAAWLPGTTTPPSPQPTVEILKQVTAAQWTTLLMQLGGPQWLPPFTQPVTPGPATGQVAAQAGYVAARVRAFVRAVQRFFTLSTAVTVPSLPAANAIPVIAPPQFDPIGAAASELSFGFGGALPGAALAAAAQDLLPGDAPAQAWLVQAMTTINELWQVAGGTPGPPLDQPSLPFAVMEALYARGFTRAADVTALTLADFQRALTGTVAYNSAAALYGNARQLAPSSPGSEAPGSGFQPVNGGSLVNCVPPPSLSPTGPIAYLREMLAVSALSTPAQPDAATATRRAVGDAPSGTDVLTFASTAALFPGMTASADPGSAGNAVTAVTATTVTLHPPLAGVIPDGTAVTFTAPTLGAVLSQRRGPVGDLTASAANLDTPLPLTDLVNECLEYLAAADSPAGGTFYDTAAGDDRGQLLAAVPEHSTPAAPDAANAGVEPAAFNRLAADFSSCRLPYSQALDVSRSYLAQLGSSRFEEMRTFRRAITEFVLDPDQDPDRFQSWLWRYPVRTDIVIEYLGLSPAEYQALFLPGQEAPQRERVTLPAFLALTCLSYCEFRELQESGFVSFRDGSDRDGDGAFPECEPCCPEEAWLQFPEGQQDHDLAELLVFVRLWRRLRESCRGGYSFAELRDICDVLELQVTGEPNPDFIRQLAAFQMLRDEFGLELTEPGAPVTPGTAGADRTHLLALWAGPPAAHWAWAVSQLTEGVERLAQLHSHNPNSTESVALLAGSLDPLSRLAGFDPGSASDSWHARPTHTLRFAEVLTKVCVSRLTAGELIFLFTGDRWLHGDDPYPLDDENDALDDPLALPGGDHRDSLWRLRGELLEAGEPAADDDAGREWSWRRIGAALETEFGFAAADITALGQHFFPRLLAREGLGGPPSAEWFTSPLAPGDTAASMWNNPPDGPFRYDAADGGLSARVPLGDRAVLDWLISVRNLSQPERQAVQDLFFQPRALLAGFALLFSDFTDAQRKLVEERDEERRLGYLRSQFLLCRRRCQLITAHLARHVATVAGGQEPDDAAAALLLRTLAADENRALSTWEADPGMPPGLTWPRPRASALAALLGLAGTGVTAEYRPQDGTVSWRDQAAGLGGFGAERDRENCPVPTVLPALDATLTPEQLRHVSAHNGMLMRDATGTWLGGAQRFTVTWTGALLIERDGTYEFWAGAPAPGEEPPDMRTAGHQRWRIELRRGQRTWAALSHHWAGDEERQATSIPLKRGVYELTAEFAQQAPDCGADEDRPPEPTGFQVKYRGPDSEGRRVPVPHRMLFTVRKDQTLRDGISPPGAGAAAYLDGLYRSTLRDIRRTYQRAFKALLLCARLELSAHPQPHGISELGYLLSQPEGFAGVSYYHGADGWTRHAANLDFDFLPVRDSYHAPDQAADARTAPLPQRAQAMFDWWERLHDYTAARADVRRRTEGRHLWHLFAEAAERQPAQPESLLRHLGADARHWPVELRYFQDQSTAVYPVTTTDLTDDRWTVRAWHADRWLRAAWQRFAATAIEATRPDLWAAGDPSATVPGESQAGNANLLGYVTHGCLDGGGPRRYADLRRLNDGLRERGRGALIAYLAQPGRVPLPWQPGAFAATAADLSDLLLLDVQAGPRETATRIEDACSAAQTLFSRVLLGLEPAWPVSRELDRLWRDRFATYRTWERARRRELYRENWIEWDDVSGARRIEAFRFLESRLRASTLTVAAPGGLDWWPEEEPGLTAAPELLQARVPSTLHPVPPALGPAPQAGTVEGFTVLGHPRSGAEPSWLAVVPQPAPSGATSEGGDDGKGSGDGNGDRNGSAPRLAAAGPAAVSVGSLAVAAGHGSAQPELPLWLQAAMGLGTRFVRVAAAGVPDAATRFVPHEEPTAGRHRDDRHEHGQHIDEYYFWLVKTLVYGAPTDSNSSPDGGGDFTGSYQFGFQDPYYDRVQQQSTEWNDEDQAASLAAQWQPQTAVRLAWCRVHDGEFGQPRRSEDCVVIGQEPELSFQGRVWDSLYLQVGGSSGTATGFRFDAAADAAVAAPQQVPAQQPAVTYPGGLPAYPFFAYHAPGARLLPASWFATSVTVAGALRARCGHELALRWYRRAFDPLRQDCTWAACGQDTSTGTGTGTTPGGDSVPAADPPAADAAAAEEPPARDGGQGRLGPCCDATQVTRQGARDRAVTLHYCQTLVEWGDWLMRHGRSPEAFRQAQVLYGTAAKITGRRPRTLLLPEPDAPVTVAEFVPAYAPLNPQLMELYDLIADRQDLVRESADSDRIRNGRLAADMPYFGDVADRDGAGDWCEHPSPYRFQSQIQKATELAGRVRELGAALLSAFEKGDAEYLASVHADQEREMQALTVAIRQDQWRDADWQVQALQQTKDLNQANLLYYLGLYQNGLLNDENQHLDLTVVALASRTGATIMEAVGEPMNIVPDGFVGAMSSGVMVPSGTKLAHLFQTIGRIMQTVADIMSTTAGMDLTQAGWQRRAVEWLHQVQTLPIEIEQTELQILGAHRRRDQALRELNNQQRQVEHATEVLDFLRGKFTATELYLWLQQETAALYRQMYELAVRAAREAERSFNFELRNGEQRFVPEETWDGPHAGLLAGERLDLALHRMERAYLDQNRRELELTKHVSLRLDFPLAYLRLRVTGYCEVDIPEWMFNLDYPGHYLRRLRAVRTTLPMTASPLTGVHARLTLLSSVTRISPEVRPPAQHCCRGTGPHSEYEACPEDPRVLRDYAAREAIATSEGQNDSGLFELSFRDERYLPFEYRGAVSRWRIELPPENNYFDPDTLTDLVLHLNYTAREGGPELRAAAASQASGRLPGDGLRVFDVRHDFPDAWPGLRGHGDASPDDGRPAVPRRLRLGFTPAMFPFVPGRPDLVIDRLLLLFAALGAEPGRHQRVRFQADANDPGCAEEIRCVADAAWPGFFRGLIDLRDHPLGPLRQDRPAACVFEVPAEAGEIRTAFLLASYDAGRDATRAPRDVEG